MNLNVKTSKFWRNGETHTRIVSATLDARPVAVIDPEDRGAVERLDDLLWATVDDDTAKADLAAALREFANPTPPKPAEPTDPAARVKDVQGDEWARVGRGGSAYWVNAWGGKPFTWDALLDAFGPVEVTP